jgi:hypothetical protein
MTTAEWINLKYIATIEGYKTGLIGKEKLNPYCNNAFALSSEKERFHGWNAGYDYGIKEYNYNQGFKEHLKENENV